MRSYLYVSLALVLLAGCGEDDDKIAIAEQAGCDSLMPELCALPWPSDRFLIEDADTETGFRLGYEGNSLPATRVGLATDPAIYNRLDGFSPASHFVVQLAAAPDLGAAARHDSVARSLEADSPTVILDLETGERVAHWVESDYALPSVLFIRPAARLAENRRYGVALRGLRPAGGEPFEVSPGFAALRDGRATTSAQLEGRRQSYDDLFAALDDAGIDVAELQLAWWLHTGSGASIRGDLLAMRDDAMTRLGPEGIGCTVDSVEDGFGGHYRRVRGTVTVPSYMDSPKAPARIVRDGDGQPMFSENVEVGFTVILPISLVNAPDGPTPGPITMFGHGLLGTGDGALGSGGLRAMAEQLGHALGATDWTGMAQTDITTVASALVDINNFIFVAERLEQGMINQIAVHRTLAGACRQLDAFHAPDGTILIDPAQRYFIGGSQGGIYGPTVLTLSPDLDRAVMVVGGSNYPLMIERSTNWPDFEMLFSGSYSERIDRIFLLNHLQQIWDFSDPASYLPFTTTGLAGIPGKKMLYIVAHNDAQVPNVASDIAARTAGLPVIEGSTRHPFGLESAVIGTDDSGFIAIDMGDPEVPFDNQPPASDEGGHGSVGFSTAALTLMEAFLQPQGRIVSPGCTDTCNPD